MGYDEETLQSMISVALCTYNGAQFIEQQLRSILEQTVSVDEVVVCDDGSGDNTVAVIKHLAYNSSIPVRIYENNPNLGVCANFDKAINLCKGDFIFLSDQDDVWRPDKVEKILDYFKKNPDKEVVFTDATFIDSSGSEYEKGKTLFSSMDFSESARRWFDKGFELECFLQNNRATGATMAIRSSIIDYLNIGINTEGKVTKPFHDYIIALSAIERKSLGYITEPLIQYRIHESQECGFGSFIACPPDYDDIFVRKSYEMAGVGYCLKDAEVVSRYNFIFRRVNRKAGSHRYFLSCVKDSLNYIRFYHSLGLRMFCYDLTHPFE